MYDTVMPRVNAVIREELSWARLKPDFAAIYAETFSQHEIDGLIAFYQGPIGSALVAKMPQLAPAFDAADAAAHGPAHAEGHAGHQG